MLSLYNLPGITFFNTFIFSGKQFYQRNGREYPICDMDNILVEITQGGIHKIAASIEIGGTESEHINSARVHFTVRRAGPYKISILVDMQHIKGSPFMKHFVSGLFIH